VVGDRVTLPCRTNLTSPVDWHYHPSENESDVYVISSAGTIVYPDSGHFALDRNASDNFSLIIQNVNHEDAGVYICREDAGRGRQHRIVLNIRGKMSTVLLILLSAPTFNAAKLICFTNVSSLLFAK